MTGYSALLGAGGEAEVGREGWQCCLCPVFEPLGAPQARKAMQEQLARNKELMQKVRVEPPEEEPCELPEGDSPALPVPTGASAANPWMLGKPSGPTTEPEAQEGPRDDTVPGAVENKDEMEEEEELSEEEALLQDFEQKRRERTGIPQGHSKEHGEELEALSWVGWQCWGTGQRKGDLGTVFGWFHTPVPYSMLFGVTISTLNV